MKTQTSPQPSAVRRRRLLQASAAAVFVLGGAGLGTQLAKRRRLFRASRLLMGTFGEIQLVHDDARQASQFLRQAFEEAQDIERRMTRFDPKSEIGRVNASAHLREIPVSVDTAEVIERGLHWAHTSNGWFDPAIGQLTENWKQDPLPRDSQKASLLGRTLFREVKLNREKLPKVRFTTSAPKLDLGGIAKGFAVDRAIHSLQESGIEQALVNFGGDLRVLGGRTPSTAWKVGLRDPHRNDQIAGVLQLRNQAVATSGNHEQRQKPASGSRFVHHLIDPFRGHALTQNLRSLSIIGDNCCDADCLATALFFHGTHETRHFLEDHTPDYQHLRYG